MATRAVPAPLAQLPTAGRLPWVALVIPTRDLALVPGVEARRGARLRARGEPRREDRALAALRVARLRHERAQARALAAGHHDGLHGGAGLDDRQRVRDPCF